MSVNNSEKEDNTVQKKGCNPLLFFPIFCLIASFFGLIQLRHIPRELATENWPYVEGTLKGLEARSASGKGNSVFFTAEYVYSVEGKEYLGKNVFAHNAGDKSMPPEINKALGEYYDHFKGLSPRKKFKGPIKVNVYYDPDNYSDAVLYPKATWAFTFSAVFGGSLLVIGLILLPLAIRFKPIEIEPVPDQDSHASAGQ